MPIGIGFDDRHDLGAGSGATNYVEVVIKSGKPNQCPCSEPNIP